MTTNFFVKDINSLDRDKEQLIYIRYDHKGMKSLFSTEDSASLNQMNFITRKGREKIDPQKPLNHKKTGHTTINERLKMKFANVELAVTEAKKSGEPSAQAVKEMYVSMAIKTTNTDEITMDMPIVEAVIYVIEKKRNQLAPNTIKAYKTLRTHLEAFISSEHNQKNRVWKISQLNRDFYDRFIDYLEEDSGLNSQGSKDNQIKNLKSTCKKLEELGFPANPLVQDFPRIQVDRNQIIYLYPEELKRIENLKFENEQSERQRDLFLLHCQIGVRYSDLNQVTRNTINLTDSILTICTQTKSKKKAQIPLSETAIQLIEKFNYTLPILSDQKYREHIKSICRSAHIDRTVQKGSKEIPLWQYVGTHIAKKTFISYALQKGMDIIDISLITGTSREVILRNYAGDKRMSEIVKAWNA